MHLLLPRLLPIFALMASAALVALGHAALPADSYLARVLFNRGGAGYPLSIQWATWFTFFIGLGNCWLRWVELRKEESEEKQGLLPLDESLMFTQKDLGPIFKKVSSRPLDHFLPSMLRRIILQFRTTQNTDEARSVLSSGLELAFHRVELRHTSLRYVLWLIPSLGFIGTVMGIGDGLGMIAKGDIDKVDEVLPATIRALSVAFDTTFLSLLLASVLMALVQYLQKREESALNRAAEFCSTHLINKLLPGER